MRRLYIDGVDISVYGAKQHNVEMAYGEIDNKSEWPEGSNIPIMLCGTSGFKKIKVGVVIKGNSRDEIWKNGNRLITSLMKPSIVKLDGFINNFCVYLKNISQAEQAIQRWHKATLELIGYEFGNQVSVSASETTCIEVENEGTLTTPAILELTPTIGKVSVTISGVVRDSITGEDKPIIIQDLTMNKTVIIDGEKGLITEDGVNKFADVDLFDFPSLLPGINKIVTDQKDVNVVVKYKPRYL